MFVFSYTANAAHSQCCEEGPKAMNTYSKKIQTKTSHDASSRSYEPVTGSANISNQAILDQLNTMKSRRREPSADVNAKLAERFGVQMTGLKIYEDEGLSEMGPNAYARGNEIHFSRGKYNPYSPSGERLLMHEAAHIVQQGTHAVSGDGYMRSSQMEAQAENVANGGQIDVSGFSMPTGSAGPIQGDKPMNPVKRLVSRIKNHRRSKHRSSDTTAQTTDTTAQTPDTTAQTSDTTAQTPDTTAQTPDTTAQTPDTTAQTPDTTAQTPDTTAQTPDTTAQPQDAAAQAPTTAPPGKHRSAAASVAISAYDKAMDARDDAKEWLSAKRKQIAKMYHGSKLEKAVHSVKAGAHRLKTGAKNLAGKVKQKIADSRIGKAAKAVGAKVKQGATAVKDVVVTGAKKAAGAVKEKVSKAADWVKDKYEGSKLQKGVKKVKHAAKKVKHAVVKVGNKIMDTGAGKAAKRAVKWIGDKKEQFKDWVDDKKYALRRHNEQRHMDRMERKSPGYKEKMRMLEAKLRAMPSVQERLAMNAKQYDPESRQFITPQADSSQPQQTTPQQTTPQQTTPQQTTPQQQQAAPEPDVAPRLSDENAGFVGSLSTAMATARDEGFIANELVGNASDLGADVGNEDAVGFLGDVGAAKSTLDSVKSARAALRTGNKSEAMLHGLDAANNGASIVLNHTVSDPVNGIVSGLSNTGIGAVRHHVHSKRQEKLRALSDEELAADIDDAHEKRMIHDSRDSAVSQLSVDKVVDKSQVAQGLIQTFGSTADLAGAGGVGTAVSTGLNLGVNAATGVITRHMKKKNARHAAYRDVFGSVEEAKKFKKENGLTERDMKILLARATDSESVYALGEHALKDQQDTLHKHAVTPSSVEGRETGAGAWFRAQGYTDPSKRDAIEYDEIGEKLGRTMSDRRLKKSYRVRSAIV